jgi:serine/threonine protein kinase/DNA-binding beta-propeller fold protein YncE
VSDEIPPAPGGFTAGSLIAGYRLEEQIGRGGMAVVFRAHDSRLDRRVALKIMAPELALDDVFRQRFIRESRAAAAVDHPHIIPVFEAGEVGGVLFIAMRYVQGGDVRSLLEVRGPLPPARVVSIITQVASALDAAHSFGLVHRDVKPANMLLDAAASSGGADHVYLSDFGLSKQSLSSSGLTGTGQFLGTLDYVAPEQIEGRAVSGRTDLYSLAGAAFEMLSGTPPFKRDQGLAVLWAQISEPPPRLTDRRPELPPAVDQVMTRALAKAPGDRYAYCLDFAAALREACGLRPADASDPGGLPQPMPGSAAQPALRQPTEVATPASPAAGPPATPRQPTEVATPASAAAASGPDAAGPPGGPPRSGGPPTEMARVPGSPGPTNPGLTDPSATSGPGLPPGGSGPGYGPVPGSGPPPGYGREPGYGPPARPWWRSRGAAAAAAAAVVIVIAGAAYVVLGAGGKGGGNGGSGHGTAVVAVAPKIPGCTTATAAAKPLSKVTRSSVSLGGHPFGVATTPSGHHDFVTLGNSLAVLKNTSAPLPTLLHTMTVPGADKGDSVASDDKLLLLASGSGAQVLNSKVAEHGKVVLLGTLSSPGGRGAVEVQLSPDGRFAFVTLQSSGGVAVFNLQAALANGFAPSSFVGLIPTGSEPVGMAVSPDGRWLYVTSIEKVATPSPSEGELSVVNLRKAEVTPARSVVSKATAGCEPVRVIVSGNGDDVWVTARASNALLGFSAAKLRSDPRHSLIARVGVGAEPIGLTFAANGNRIVVADSDLTQLAGENPSLSVVSTPAALAGKPALLGQVATGLLPRQFATEGNTLLVTDDGSGQLQAINLADLP